jgi:hypothetical protein
MKIGLFCFDFLDILFFFMKTRMLKDDNYLRALLPKVFGLIPGFYPFIN